LWFVLNHNEILAGVTPESAAFWNLIDLELLKDGHLRAVHLFGWILPQAFGSCWLWAAIDSTFFEFTVFINTAVITSIKINGTIIQRWILFCYALWISKLTLFFL
jgi:hypothetical protein